MNENDKLLQLIDCIVTGQFEGKEIKGYWVKTAQKWFCPDCFKNLLNSVRACTDEMEAELTNENCDSCFEPIGPIIDGIE